MPDPHILLLPPKPGLPVFARRTDTSSADVATKEYGSGSQAGKDGLYDYVDAHVPMLARMYEKRLKGYRAIGYELEGEPANDADV